MPLLTLPLALALLFQVPSPPQVPAAFDHTHARWTEVLARHVHDDRFDYAGLKRDRATFDAYLAELQTVTADQLAGWTRPQRYAFWINTYNAHAVDLVTRNYPLESIKDLGGLFSSVWDQRFVPMQALHPDGKDRALSLDDIEHEILRPRFQDARVHAAVNCASLGCPPLRNEAFVAERLEAQLDEQVRQWLADPRRNRFDARKATLEISEVFKWFHEDFERDAGSVEAWVLRYAPPAEAEWMRATKQIRRKYLDYSWKLNAYVAGD